MILIISEKNDLTSNEVIDWLITMGKTPLRVNPGEAVIVGFDLQTNNYELRIGERCVNSTEIDMIWYRRGGLEFNFHLFSSESQLFDRYASVYLQQEYKPLKEMVYQLMKEGKSINSDLDSDINKLEVLHKAKQAGLSVPRTIIGSRRTQIEHFMESYDLDEVITKSIKNGFSYWDDTLNLEEYTSLVKLADLETYPTDFFPSLIQENISKQYEIRTFFIEKNCYSVAVFSQSHTETQIDSRRANTDKPHRSVPFNLPESIEKKLLQLMQELGLNSGSVDFIYSKADHFIFLEVNPIGQFAQVSYPGNYYLEEIVAQTLIQGAHHES